MAVVAMSYLLEAGVHFGHQTKRWNPKMKEYIYSTRDDIYIMDLQKTALKLEEAYAKIKEIVDSIKRDMADYDPAEEFGMDKTTYDKHTADVTKMFEDMLDETNIENVKLPGDTEDYDKKVDIDKKFLKNPVWEVVYENHGWDFVKDFYNKFSQLEDGKEYSLLFLVKEDKSNRTGFSNTIMSMLLDSNEGKNRKLNCNVFFSEDNKNHFWLLKKRV